MEDNEILAQLDTITKVMVESQNNLDGGWGAEMGHRPAAQSSDCWSTAEVVLWLQQYNSTQYRDQINAGLRFLEQNQKTEENADPQHTEVDGGWGWQLDRPSEATATALALLACVRRAKAEGIGGVAQNFIDSVSKGRDWLIARVNPDGGWSLLPQPHSSAFNTCWSSIALKECLDVPTLTDPRIRPAILPHALTLVESSRRARGWGNLLAEPADALGTAYCVFLLASMGRPQAANPGIQYLLNTQGYNGCWEPGPAESPVEATAWATKALLSIPAIRREARVVNAVDSGFRYLQSMYVPKLGWPAEPGDVPMLWTTYYACLALLSQVDARREDEGAGGILRSRHRRKVFIVHGHHEALREDIKHVVSEMAFEPVVLQEMPSQGTTTIIEKFEYYAQQEGVDFALVAATPDGIDITDKTSIARGNVVAELGYFIGKLGRNRVCILKDPTVTLPSDFDGVGFINVRNRGWKDELRAQLRKFNQMQDSGTQQERE